MSSAVASAGRSRRGVAGAVLLAVVATLGAGCGGGGGGDGGDAPPPPSVYASAFEAAGTLVVQVGRFEAAVGAVSVTYDTLDDTAIAGQDYTSTSGTLNWGNGDNGLKTIVIPLLNDLFPEPDEHFWIVLGTPTGGATLCTVDRRRLEIEDDDAAGACPPSTPTCTMIAFDDAESAASEDDGTVQIVVERHGATSGAVQVGIQVTGGSATTPSDFTLATTTVSWVAGDASAKLVNVTLANDAVPETAETVVLSLVNPTRDGGECVEVCTPHTLTIQDDDGPGTLVFADTCVEESGGTQQLFVGRVGGSTGAVSVSYTTSDGTATSPADYGAVSGTLNWADGDSAPKFINVAIVNDAVTDVLETFTVTFSGPTGGVGLPDATMVVTIVQGSVFSRPATAQVAECDGFVQLVLTVRCDSIAPGDTINYSTSNGTATAGSDYVADSGNAPVDFDGTATVVIDILDDAIVEGSETFNIHTGSAGNSPTVVTILDDDPNGTIECDVAEVKFSESAGAEQLLVVRGPCSGGAASVDWALVDGSALSGSDYTAPFLSGTFNWPANDLTGRSVSLTILDDVVVEGVETLSLRLSNVSGASLGTRTQTLVRITDNDGAGCIDFVDLAP